MNRAPIEGKVAGILTERELVINVGTNKGVQKAMKFKVLAKPAEITDPDTGELLATIAREKVRVEATDVHEKYSICSTYRVTVVYPGLLEGYWSSLSTAVSTTALSEALQHFEKPREVVETLKAEDSELAPYLSEEESYVKVGDPVVQILANQ